MAVNPSANDRFQQIQDNPVANGSIHTKIAFHVAEVWGGSRPAILLVDNFGNETKLEEDDTLILDLHISLDGNVRLA